MVPRSGSFYPTIFLMSVLLLMPLSGCAAYVAGSTVVGAGKLAVKGTVGAVKLAGHGVGAVAGLASGDEEEEETSAAAE